ncbi:3-oxo-5-alpha-steroid 4-dehydrogenase 2-like [Siniperca chuatsi]|uniref:3-oxo-5-alpha-steroid 4-dehydrogenase 2-like n=1 Tax=Siniperca chuatsi TaxID=119488 RepID=UPI001CE05175|nr:3-oxo-5-alpha-steroid 4-dehydrogenase 2-like [Siniperca chuatsi]
MVHSGSSSSIVCFLDPSPAVRGSHEQDFKSRVEPSGSGLMECRDAAVSYLSWALIVGGVAYLQHQRRSHTQYGRYVPAEGRCCSARVAWFLQEVPSFLLPLLLLLLTEEPHSELGGSGHGTARKLLLCCFMLHYFHRSFIYGFLTRGRPVPLPIVLYAAIFCSLNGFLQGHHLLHCAQFEDTWLTDARLAAGFLLFAVGMVINIHSDFILRSLRKPGETVYRIPHGGMFEFVSGANFFGEIVEWCGYAVASWSLPTFAFAFFTACSIGPRACQHHRDYQQRFEDYPRGRKAVLPFLL